MIVKSLLEKLGLHYTRVELCEIEIMEDISPAQMKSFASALRRVGLELTEDKESVIVEKIKAIIIERVRYSDDDIRVNLSDYISDKFNHNYSHLSSLFSESKGKTIEQFYLELRIEKAKELITYDELNVTEIAQRMNYNSVAHLSNQFKKMTGMTPSEFKNLKIKSRIDLSEM